MHRDKPYHSRKPLGVRDYEALYMLFGFDSAKEFESFITRQELRHVRRKVAELKAQK